MANASSSLFRSEKMSLVQLYIPAEGAPAVVSELGSLGLLEFRDLNAKVNAFQRAFVSDIRRLDEMERKLRYLAAQMEKVNIVPRSLAQTHHATYTRSAHEMHELESNLTGHEAHVLQMNASYETLLRRSLELTEHNYVLHRAAKVLEITESNRDEIRRSFEEPDTPLLQSQFHLESGDDSQRSSFGFVAGVIERARLPTFERVLWRALRGNLHMTCIEIEEPIANPATEELVHKNVFVIFAHGHEILAKIRKISEALGGTIYPVDSNAEVRRDTAMNVQARLNDVINVLEGTSHTRHAELAHVANHYNFWMLSVKKEKAVYHTLNLFNYDVNRKCLIAEGWCPASSIGSIQAALRSATEHLNTMAPAIVEELPTAREPPTYHRTNKFTEGFQSIVDAYGVARYGEVNPGLFTIISFPFLFALMFGDLGHGAIMTGMAAWVCLRERQLSYLANSELFGMMYHGRYIVLLMGIFSMYTGLIYNDIFSRPMHFWHSGWEWHDVKANTTADARQVGVYPVGIDPLWHGSDNALLFTNSYKMKMSILFGVIQMSFGILLTIFNHRHFKRPVNIWAEFVPQMLFMQCIFGYLSLCILYKWSVDWYATDALGHSLHGSPPSLLNMLIFMFLSPGYIKEGEQLFPGQGPVQLILLAIALICVPWMLLAKPLIIKAEMDRVQPASYNPVGDDAVSHTVHAAETASISSAIDIEDTFGGGEDDGDESGHHETHDFGDLMIHQSIHTIEFCLNSISNTASYLRLWALSLAHAQLSSVLWDMTLAPCFLMTGIKQVVALVIMFTFWLSVSVSILIVMEGLSAFLHALRLHWVEFNSKFYEGSGRKFEPFSYQHLLEETAQD